ncbi:CsbD family protein [Pseudactinotalea suaedae]|uniref:CsbD family protein n=1 Tax=Pseudactinotalea suaedae TaxID=1524924 RepID=UPI0012E12DB3|nr:CsbD family protein [Pseudactinotalea suaedae]
MGMDDKVKNATQEAVGKAKKGVGDATDNRDLQAEGAGEEAGAKVKKAAEDVKDGARDAADDIRDATR